MIRRITLIEPKNDHLHIFSKFELPRLGSTLLATIMRDRGYQAESLFMRSKDILAKRIETDLVAFRPSPPPRRAPTPSRTSFAEEASPLCSADPT